METEVCNRIQTKILAKCRAEPAFEPIIVFDNRGKAHINCPHCGRGYYRRPDGTWHSDRNLIFLADPDEVRGFGF